MSRFCCLYLPDFAAWAAVRHNRALRGKPVVIHAAGRITAASPEAHAAGAQVGWTLSRTQSRVPDVVALPYHATLCMMAWDEVLSSLYQLTPQIESMRPGLAFLQGVPAAPFAELLREWQAQGGNAQGGIADDRTTAELAALTVDAGKLRQVRTGSTAAFLKHIPVTCLAVVGVSAPTIGRLGWFGWSSVGHLRHLTKRHLATQFPEGDILYRYAQANDVRRVPYYTPPVCIEEHITFDEPVQQPYEIEPALHHAAERVTAQLDGQVARSVTVALDTSRGRHQCLRILRSGSADAYKLREAALQTLYQLLTSGMEVSRLEVRLGGLVRPKPIQGQLFGAARPAVRAALRMVERRFPGRLQRIVPANPGAYLPEERFRLVPLELAKPGSAKPGSTKPGSAKAGAT